jgi:hypothetical protein
MSNEEKQEEGKQLGEGDRQVVFTVNQLSRLLFDTYRRGQVDSIRLLTNVYNSQDVEKHIAELRERILRGSSVGPAEEG